MTLVCTFGIQIGIVLALCAGCSDDETGGWRVTEGDGDSVAYGTMSDVVVTSDGIYIVTNQGGEGCVNIDGQCVDIQEAEGRYCDDPDGTADYFLDADGNVVSAVCYPPADGGTTVQELQTDADGKVTLPSNQNGVVITFPDSSDGQPLVGDLTLNGERVVLFGNGADETIIDGNVLLASNNARLRGLTVMGNLNVASNANNGSIAFCNVRGDLVVEGNGTTIAGCNVYGDVNVNGNSATLVNIGVQGAWNINGSATCSGCFSFADANQDFVIDAMEVGDPIECK